MVTCKTVSGKTLLTWFHLFKLGVVSVIWNQDSTLIFCFHESFLRVINHLSLHFAYFPIFFCFCFSAWRCWWVEEDSRLYQETPRQSVRQARSVSIPLDDLCPRWISVEVKSNVQTRGWSLDPVFSAHEKFNFCPEKFCQCHFCSFPIVK